MTGKRFGRVLAIVLALTMLAGMVPAFAAGETAESVYVNGNIYTMDDDNPHATAMAIRGDKLLYVGDKAGAEAYYISGVTKVVDLQEVILQAVKEAAEAAQPGEWIQGRGWMNTVWADDSFPTKEELDAVAPNNPVSLQRADAHMFWFNSMALDMAGITKDTPNPQSPGRRDPED